MLGIHHYLCLVINPLTIFLTLLCLDPLPLLKWLFMNKITIPTNFSAWVLFYGGLNIIAHFFFLTFVLEKFYLFNSWTVIPFTKGKRLLGYSLVIICLFGLALFPLVFAILGSVSICQWF